MFFALPCKMYCCCCYWFFFVCKQYFVSICHSIFHLSKLMVETSIEKEIEMKRKSGNHQRECWSIGWLPINHFEPKQWQCFEAPNSVCVLSVPFSILLCALGKNANRPRYFNNKINLYVYWNTRAKRRQRKKHVTERIHVTWFCCCCCCCTLSVLHCLVNGAIFLLLLPTHSRFSIAQQG